MRSVRAAPAALAGLPVLLCVGVSAQLHLPALNDEPPEVVPYLSAGAFRFLRADERGHAPAAWAVFGGSRH